MSSKKHAHADLENKRSIFFLLGTSLSLLLLIFAFQYKTEKVMFLQNDVKPKEIETVSISPPITIQNPSSEIPKPMPIEEIFQLVEILPSEPEVDPSIKLNIAEMGQVDNDLVEVPVEIIEEPEVVDIYGADKIAVPFECSSLSDKAERIDCLNNWMAKEIRSKIKYPRSEIRNRNEGMVFISFEVSEKGVFSNIKVVQGVSPNLDEEAQRVISLIPNISPAIYNGRPAKMTMTIPVSFKLN